MLLMTRTCECGCGETPNPAPFTSAYRGWVKGEPVRYIKGHARRIETVRDGEKRCGRCKDWKPLDEFHRAKNGKAGRDHYCKVCQRTRQHAGWLERKYGLQPDDWQSILDRQGGGCAICGRGPSGATVLDVDHCHNSERIRGLLCRKCNVVLGQVGDDPELLERAAAYLRQPG